MFSLFVSDMNANKYYVVWVGAAPGVYDSWEEAELQVRGYPGAVYRSYKSETEAVEAFRAGYDKENLLAEVARQVKSLNESGRRIEWVPEPRRGDWIAESIAVDAACSGNPGAMEYRGVYVRTGKELFRIGPMQEGTNNIGEFLAIVHALAMQEKQGTALPIYSDSKIAQGWVREGVCKTKLERTVANAPIFDLVQRAQIWLATHRFRLPILKWDTKAWGEIPADFGRK